MSKEDGKDRNAICKVIEMLNNFQFNINYTTLFTIFYAIILIWFFRTIVVALGSDSEKIIYFKYSIFAFSILIVLFCTSFHIVHYSHSNLIKILLPIIAVGIISNVVLNSVLQTYFEDKGYIIYEGNKKHSDFKQKVGNSIWITMSKNEN